MAGGRVTSYVRGGEPSLRTRGVIVSRSVIVCTKYVVRHPRGSYFVLRILFAVSGSGHIRKQINYFDPVIHTQERPHHNRFLTGCSSPFVGLAEHLTTLRVWC